MKLSKIHHPRALNTTRKEVGWFYTKELFYLGGGHLPTNIGRRKKSWHLNEQIFEIEPRQ